jgi:translation initiation factor 2B subunit (eIF-2B alpha/beta/delta family)
MTPTLRTYELRGEARICAPAMDAIRQLFDAACQNAMLFHPYVSSVGITVERISPDMVSVCMRTVVRLTDAELSRDIDRQVARMNGTRLVDEVEL